MKDVIFHPEAEDELDRSIGFYESRRTGLGIDFENDVIQGISTIVEDPMRWPEYKFGLRKFNLKRFPYSIYYLDMDAYIWIVAIAHGARRPGYWKARVRDM